MSPLLYFAFFGMLFFGVCAIVAGISYAIGYTWSLYDQWRESRWIVVAEGSFKTITDGVRQFVHLEDGRRFLLVLDHRELDFVPGERVRVLIGHCKRHVVQRAARPL